MERILTLTSSAFENGGVIPVKYTCDGENSSPPLKVTNTYESIDSFVLIMDDPDAVKPAGHVWDHWVVFNIPPTSFELGEGENPQGILGVNSGGMLAYGGPCPPDGEHRYFFKLYGISGMLELPEGVTKKQVEEAIQGRSVAEATLMGRYTRQ